MIEFIRWRDAVVKQVRFWPDRKAIRQELNDHYEDKVADLERLGYDRELAESRALESMGDAEEVGKAFDKVHKPWLGWLWKVTTWLAVVLILVTVWNALFGYRGLGSIVSRQDLTPDLVDYEPEGDYFAPIPAFTVERVWMESPTYRVERLGCEIALPYAAIWRNTHPEGMPTYWLSFVLVEKDLYFWEQGPQLNEIQIVGENGWQYRQRDSQRPEEKLGYVFMNTRENLFRAVYEGSIFLGEEPGEWIELTYPYGESWTFRLDWEEAELE